MLQGLLELPRNLQQAVLGSAELSLFKQLHLLPVSLHETALHAAFPSIAASSSITVHTTLDCPPSFWQVLGNMTSLKSLSCSGSWSYTRNSRVEISHISRLTQLTSLALRVLEAFAPEHETLLTRWLMRLASLEDLTLSNTGLLFDSIIVSLSQIKSLRRLDVSDKTLRTVSGLDHALAQLERLECLNVNGCKFSLSPRHQLAARFGQCKFLTKLCIGGVDEAAIGMQHLVACSRLEHLEVSCDHDRGQLPESFSTLTSLKVLKVTLGRLTGFRPTLNEAQRVGSMPQPAVLANLTNLEQLHLSGRGLSDTEVKELVNGITTLTSLQVLHINCSFICVHGSAGTALGKFLSQLPKFEELQMKKKFAKHHILPVELMQGERAGAPTIGALMPYLGMISTLRKLSFREMLSRRNGADAFRSAGVGLAYLPTIDLHVNGIRTEKIRTLAPMLPYLAHVQELDVSKNLLSAEAVEYLSEFIGSLSGLQVLCLADNPILERGIAALAPQIANLSKLKELILSRTCIGDSGAAVLAKHLGCYTSLCSLNLEACDIGEVGAAELTRVSNSLTALTIYGIPVLM